MDSGDGGTGPDKVLGDCFRVSEASVAVWGGGGFFKFFFTLFGRRFWIGG